MPPAYSAITTTAALVVAVTVILTAFVKSAKFTRRVVHVVDDIVGVPAQNGEPAIPGISHRLALIEAELKPNGGSSMRDKIDRLEVWTTGHSLVHADITDKMGNRVN